MEQEVGWAWGGFEYIGKHALFESEGDKGGYMCKICGAQLSKRVDGLKNHIEKNHKEVPAADVAKLINTIPKVAVKCPKCKIPLTGLGHKLKVHLEKWCKGPSVEDEPMSQEDNSNKSADEDPMDQGNTKSGEQLDISMKQGNMIGGDTVKVLKKRKRSGSSLWDRIKDPLKKVIKDAQEENENILDDMKDLEMKIDEQKQEINFMGTLLETKDQEIRDLQDKLRNKDADAQEENENILDDMKDLEMKIDEQKQEINFMGTLLETKDQEIRDLQDKLRNKDAEIDTLKEIVNVHANHSDKIDHLEKENEDLLRINKRLATDMSNLHKKIEDLNVVIKNSRKVEDIDVQKVKDLVEIGQGGFGKVLKGQYRGRDIAIKVMKLHWTSIRELLIQVKMNSPNLMRSALYGINWDEKNMAKSEILLGMELCESSIYDLIRNKKLDLEKKHELVMGAASGVQQLHSVPVIHMDIKPENFLLKGNVVKLTDFGLSNFGTTGEGKAGTPGYIAPEVVQSLSVYSNKCDMWSLGATLYEIVSGYRLVSKRKLMENPEKEYEMCAYLSPEWENIGYDYKDHVKVFKDLLVKDPEKRLSADNCLRKFGKIDIKKKC